MSDEREETPIMQIIDTLKAPQNSLSPQEKKEVREVTSNSDSAIKTSLVNLFMERFSKVALYDTAIQTILNEIVNRATGMEATDLVSLLGVLTKTSSSESKNILEMFKKNGNDFGTLAKEISKLNENITDKISKKEDKEDKPAMKLSQDELDRVLRFIDKVDKQKDGTTD